MQKMSDDKKQELWNEYFYPNTNTFINKLGITDDQALQKTEAELSFKRLVELLESEVEGNFDLKHLCYINWYLFQDLYEWAGKIRNVNISTGKSNFANVAVLKDSIEYELNLMKEDYTYLLEVHPFRDGNGRTVREFLREFTLVQTKQSYFGEFELDWSKVDFKTLNESMSNSKYLRSVVEQEINKALVSVDKLRKESINVR